MRAPPFLLGAGLLSGCMAFHRILEADPVTHVLVMLPSLALAGSLLAASWKWPSFAIAERYANALTLVGVFAILFWMLPRYIDASLTSPAVEAVKLISIPTLVGGLLTVAWRRSNPFLRGFLKANALSMLGVLAFLYTHASSRICNSYLVADQERLGYGFLIVALALAVIWAVPLFLAPLPEQQASVPAARNAAL